MHTGVVNVEWPEIISYRAIHTKKLDGRVSDGNVARCRALYRGIQEAIHPDTTRLIVEFPHAGAMDASAMRAMALATATVACVVEVRNLPLYSVTPTQVKQAATGRPKAEKDEMIAAAQRAFVWPPSFATEPKRVKEHVADAAWAVVAGLGLLFEPKNQ